DQRPQAGGAPVVACAAAQDREVGRSLVEETRAGARGELRLDFRGVLRLAHAARPTGAAVVPAEAGDVGVPKTVEEARLEGGGGRRHAGEGIGPAELRVVEEAGEKGHPPLGDGAVDEASAHAVQKDQEKASLRRGRASAEQGDEFAHPRAGEAPGARARGDLAQGGRRGKDSTQRGSYGHAQKGGVGGRGRERRASGRKEGRVLRTRPAGVP